MLDIAPFPPTVTPQADYAKFANLVGSAESKFDAIGIGSRLCSCLGSISRSRNRKRLKVLVGRVCRLLSRTGNPHAAAVSSYCAPPRCAVWARALVGR